MAKDYDASDFKAVVDYALHLKDTYAERDQMLDRMRDIYMLKDGDADKLKQKYANVSVTISPDAANAVETAVRLMTANNPDYNVPEELHADLDDDVLDSIEKISAMMMRASDRVRGAPVHVDGARSGILYDEIHISVNNTADMLEYVKGSAPGVVKRMERIAKLTPFLFEVHNPRGCYADFDNLGLRAWARLVEMTGQEIIEQWGDDGRNAINILDESKAREAEFDVWLMWDLTNYTVWIDGAGEPICMEPHGLSFIPVVVHTVEGSRIFDDVDEQRRPFLYNLDKSGIWKRQNLALSAIFSNVQTRMWTALVYNANEDDADPEIDLTMPINITRIPRENKLAPLPSDPALNSMWQAWTLAQGVAEQSTIYRTVGGQPLGGGATYSETALLNQAGRLPLTAIQRKLAWALGDALRLAFLWMKESPQNEYSARARGKYATVNAAAIPDDLEIEVVLDVALPQDRLQQANIFNILRDRVPDEYLYENLLHIRQPGEMRDRLWKQRIFDALAGQQLQQMLQPPAPPEMPAAPEMGGAPMGLPPEMMAGGMQGPETPAFEQGMEGMV